MSLLVRLLLIVAFLSFSASGAIAKTPDEECSHAEEAGLSCEACGDCAVITTKVGEKLYKLCDEYDCNLASADECTECD
jgi:hypothetical protein